MMAANTTDKASAHTCTPTPPAEVTQAITALRKRLARWELEHLRRHCADLAQRLDTAQTRIETLETEVWRAWDAADSWRDQTHELVNELQHAGRTIGLTQDGALVAMGAGEEGGAA